MRVVTPAMKLDVRIDELAAKDGLLQMSGVAGMLPCETTLRPSILKLLLSSDPPPPVKPAR